MRAALTELLQYRLAELDRTEHLESGLREAWVSETWRELQDALSGLGEASRAALLNARAVPRCGDSGRPSSPKSAEGQKCLLSSGGSTPW